MVLLSGEMRDQATGERGYVARSSSGLTSIERKLVADAGRRRRKRKEGEEKKEGEKEKKEKKKRRKRNASARPGRTRPRNRSVTRNDSVRVVSRMYRAPNLRSPPRAPTLLASRARAAPPPLVSIGRHGVPEETQRLHDLLERQSRARPGRTHREWTRQTNHRGHRARHLRRVERQDGRGESGARDAIPSSSNARLDASDRASARASRRAD